MQLPSHIPEQNQTHYEQKNDEEEEWITVPKEKGNTKLYVLTHFTIDVFREMALSNGADSFLDKANDIDTTLPNMIESYAA